jgi:1,4-dihydroxy-2-naphthoate polyprenyltransferase
MSKSNFNLWISALRPKTLWAAIAPILMASAMCYKADLIHYPSILAALSAALLIQIGTNLANDYYDCQRGSDREDRIGPNRMSQSGNVSPQKVKLAFIIAFGLAILIGAYLLWRGGWPILLIGLSSVLFGILYTGGPRPLAYIGLGDVFAFLYFGPIALAGTWYIQALYFNLDTLIIGIIPGLFSAALLTVNNYRDTISDRRSAKLTLAVRFGPIFSRYEFACCLLGTILLPVYLVLFRSVTPYVLILIPLMLVKLKNLLAPFKQLPNESEQFGDSMNALLAKVGQSELIYSVVFSLAWILSP